MSQDAVIRFLCPIYLNKNTVLYMSLYIFRDKLKIYGTSINW